MAVDNDGNNALHLLLSTYHYVNHKDEYRTTLSLLIEKAPALVSSEEREGIQTPPLRHPGKTKVVMSTAPRRRCRPSGARSRGKHAPPPSCGGEVHARGGKRLGSVLPEVPGPGRRHQRQEQSRRDRPVQVLRGRVPKLLEALYRPQGSLWPFRGRRGGHLCDERRGRNPAACDGEKGLRSGQGDVLDTLRFLMELGLDPMAEDKQRTAVVSFPLSPTRRWEVMCKC